MDAAGQLSGGIAHDLKYELSVILLNSEMLAGRLEAHGLQLVEELQDVQDAANRATEMTRQLVGFTHRAVLDEAHMQEVSQ